MLTIRDPRAAALARQLAQKRHISMTEAVVTALENELRQDEQAPPLETRLRALAAKAKAMAGPNGREMTREEIDDLSGC